MAYRVGSSTREDGILSDVNEIPEVCPACGKGIQPIFSYQHAVDEWRAWDGFLQIVFRCPRKDCQRLFIALYRAERYAGDVSLILRKNYLLDFVEFEEFSETIKKVSEKFSRIYNQARIAEENGLDEISGAGYGRALEFLIKDYLIHKNPDSSNKIKKIFLSDAIKELGDEDANIKKCAERANWLRTDEAHYERRWEGQDINDLKTLIKLSVNWIENSLLTEEYEKDMPPKEKAKQERK